MRYDIILERDLLIFFSLACTLKSDVIGLMFCCWWFKTGQLACYHSGSNYRSNIFFFYVIFLVKFSRRESSFEL